MGRSLLQDDAAVVQRADWYQVITPSSPGARGNEVYWSSVSEADAERVIDETIARYSALGKPTKWVVGPWTKPADFGARLERRGFASWRFRAMGIETGRSVVNEADAARINDDPSRRDPVTAVTIEEVGPSSLREYVSTSLAGWSEPRDAAAQARDYEWLRSRLEVAPERRVMALFMARVAGEPVGTAALSLRDDYGYLLGTQVLENARGRGAYRALVDARLRFLRARGSGYAVTHAREATSAPILEHLGFETLFGGTCYQLG